MQCSYITLLKAHQSHSTWSQRAHKQVATCSLHWTLPTFLEVATTQLLTVFLLSDVVENEGGKNRNNSLSFVLLPSSVSNLYDNLLVLLKPSWRSNQCLCRTHQWQIGGAPHLFDSTSLAAGSLHFSCLIKQSCRCRGSWECPCLNLFWRQWTLIPPPFPLLLLS